MQSMVLACSMPVIEKAQAGLHLPPLSSSPGVHVSPNLDEKALLLEVAAQLIKNSKEGLQMNTALVVVVQVRAALSPAFKT